MAKSNETYNYTYSAEQQEEIKRIRQKYTTVTKAENKMEQLRELDKSVTKPGSIAAIVVGIIGTLLLGVGMCCTMVWQDFFVLGIVVGIVGIAVVVMAYPIYNAITKQRKATIAPQILELTKELTKENQ